MFKLIEVASTVRIPPDRFGEPLERVASSELGTQYTGMVSKELGYVIAVVDIKAESIGKIIPGDGATYHRILFSLLCYQPQIQGIVEGEVVEIEDFGAFVRIGPMDALLHVSQIINDFVSYDGRQATLTAKETGRTLRPGEIIRARITVVSFAKGGSSGKIGLTMRQPYLGKLDWIHEDVEKLRKNQEVNSK
jgi:DNA-directed RNA polymerase subunit E'